MKRFMSMLLLSLVVMSTAFIVGCGPKEEATTGDPAADTPTRYDEKEGGA